MTQQLTTTQAMDALAAARPDPELIDQAWDEQRAESVLQSVSEAASKPARAGRRWALVAAAVALVAGAGLLAQTAIPAGVPGAPAEANALERLAQVINNTPIPADSYAQETIKIQQVNAGVVIKASTTRWVASDGWVWSVSDSSDTPEKTYQKAPDLIDPHSPAAVLLPDKLPRDPAALKQLMVERYDELMTHSNRSPAEVHAHQAASLLAAIYEDLADPRTTSDDRAVLLRTLALVDGLTITTNTTDPENRPALAARVTYHRAWDDSDQVSSVYFDPANGDPLALEERTSDGSLTQARVITDRRIVAALPERIIKVLGTKRVAKTVDRVG
jgi:hypothetical protein